MKSLALVTVPFALFALAAAACDTEDATMVVADDDYAPGTTVYKVWWLTTLMPDAVAPGAEGQPERTVPGSDTAYAVLAPGWDPMSSAPPQRLVFVKSAAPLAVARGDTLHVHVSADAFVGDCAAGKPLSQDDADFITQRIFPAEIAGMTYDAATCTATPAPPATDGGTTDGATDGP
jgi:hypothetical protein